MSSDIIFENFIAKLIHFPDMEVYFQMKTLSETYLQECLYAVVVRLTVVEVHTSAI